MTRFLLLFTSPILAASAFADFTGSDSFGTITGNWSDDVISGSAQFTVINGRLEFTTSAAPSNNDAVARFWDLNFGSYTSDWAVRMDTFLGTFPMSTNGFASLAMYIENLLDPSNDFLRVVLRRDGTTARYFESDGYANGTFLGTQFVATSATSAALQLRYAAATHVLTAGYDSNGPVGGYTFTPIVSYDIDSPSANWGMTANDSFRLRIYGQSVQTQMSSGQAYFDNFLAVPELSSGTLVLSGILLFARRGSLTTVEDVRCRRQRRLNPRHVRCCSPPVLCRRIKAPAGT